MNKHINGKNSSGISSITLSILFWVVFIFLLFIVSSQLGSLFPQMWERFSYGIFGTFAAFLATFVFLKIDKKKFKEIGLVWERNTLLRFLTGIIIGTAIFMLILVVLLNFSELKLEKNKEAINQWAAFWYLAIIPLAFMEEVAFRSYPFLKLKKAFGLRVTQIIVAIAFALYHIIGGHSVSVAFLGPGIWAFVYGLAAAWSGGIAVPTGIHVALNVLQPLVGMRGAYQSIWILNYKEGIPEDSIAKAENIGLMIHLVILVCAIALTEFFIRKQQKE